MMCTMANCSDLVTHPSPQMPLPSFSQAFSSSSVNSTYLEWWPLSTLGHVQVPPLPHLSRKHITLRRGGRSRCRKIQEPRKENDCRGISRPTLSPSSSPNTPLTGSARSLHTLFTFICARQFITTPSRDRRGLSFFRLIHHHHYSSLLL